MKKKNRKLIENLTIENENLKESVRTMQWQSDLKDMLVDFFCNMAISFISEEDVPEIKNVVFNAPKTTVYFSDGTSSTAICAEKDTYAKDTGFAVALAKKAFGQKYYAGLDKFCKEK